MEKRKTTNKRHWEWDLGAQSIHFPILKCIFFFLWKIVLRIHKECYTSVNIEVHIRVGVFLILKYRHIKFIRLKCLKIGRTFRGGNMIFKESVEI